MVARTGRHGRREGVVLLIVMAMLALFASVGLTFVFYAESEANISRTARAAENLFVPEVEPELLLNYFLSQLIYDTDNEYSALRGHSLGLRLYGGDPTRNGKNGIPFNGAGGVEYAHTYLTLAGMDNRRLVNLTKYDLDNFTLLPEHYSVKEDPAKRFVGAGNGPWTYPGLNNAYLAAVNALGEVLLQSYKRPWAEMLPADPKYPQLGKYTTFHPHPTYHPAFPPPEDGGGHVRNLPFGPGVKKPGGGYWINDSFWLDAGFPVMTAANGRKYKVLFAPMIIDLDNRINLMVHGNLVNGGSAHLSHQGWGRWEVNPFRILDPTEFTNFLKGPGRYTDGKPDGAIGPAQMPPYYSRFNFDNIATGPLALPTAGSLSVFPTYPPGWDSGNDAETKLNLDHPKRYSYFSPVAGGNDRRPIHPSHMEAILRPAGKGSPSLTSELFKHMPKSMASKARNLVTLLSHDLDRPGLVPFLTSASTYNYNPLLRHAEANVPLAFPDPATTPTPGGDFMGPIYASKLGTLNRLNLNRQLTDYPLPDPLNGNMISDLAGLAKSQSERQKMAQDIFEYLVLATGAKDPNTVAMVQGSNEYHASRWLAQLAVNIVDYIDNDDYMTTFTWDRSGKPSELLARAVYGSEMSRLVINEAYAQYDNDPADKELQDPDPAKQKAAYYRINTWVELYDPFKATPAGENTPRDGGHAKLKTGTNSAYQVVVTRPDPKLRDPDNNRGDPDPARILKSTGGGDCVVDDWVDGSSVEPGDGLFNGPQGSNKGFFVAGPVAKDHLPGFNPGIATSHATSKLSARHDFADPAPVGSPVTVLLRRLACPHMPASPRNPYITVDYLETVPAFDARGFDNKGKRLGIGKGKNKDPDLPPWVDSFSVGRNQPYAAHVSQLKPQVPQTNPNGPKHTFYQQNCIETTPPPPAINYAAPNQTLVASDWLVHLDRQLINPMELLHVSGYRPHEVTQQFVTPAGKHKHIAPWFEEKALLYRFLEMVYTPDLMLGTPVGGRIPGRININTIWDVETFRAICDASLPGGLSGFSDAEVDAIFAALVAERTPDPLGIPGNNDKPFFPLAAGVHPGGGQYFFPTGIDSTLLKKHPTAPTTRLFDVPGKSHPYQQMELLTKIYGNLTTRSNVFAVWVTAGFFEVTDDTVRPVRIGAEIGKDENRHVRHRFFSIVDRTQLQMRPILSNGADNVFTLLGGLTPAPGASTTGTLTFVGKSDLTFDTLNGAKWSIEPGTVITIGPDLPNEETVVVTTTDVKNASFSFQVTKAHAAGEQVICRCWHGPWPNYDVRRDSKVVPFFTVIE